MELYLLYGPEISKKAWKISQTAMVSFVSLQYMKTFQNKIFLNLLLLKKDAMKQVKQ